MSFRIMGDITREQQLEALILSFLPSVPGEIREEYVKHFGIVKSRSGKIKRQE